MRAQTIVSIFLAFLIVFNVYICIRVYNSDTGSEILTNRNGGYDRTTQSFSFKNEAGSKSGDLISQQCGSEDYAAKPFPFLNGLASFPGSGNTLLRYLVQTGTGILTGSEYKDHELLIHGFPAEGVVNRSVVLVKTHGSDNATLARYRKVVLLMRHPREAILSEFNRVFVGRNGLPSKSVFVKEWRGFYKMHMNAWLDFHTNWHTYGNSNTNYNNRINSSSKSKDGSKLVVLYHDLVLRPHKTLKNVFKFLQVNYDPQRVSCAVQRSRSLKRKRKAIDVMRLYSKDDQLALDKMYTSMMIKLTSN